MRRFFKKHGPLVCVTTAALILLSCYIGVLSHSRSGKYMLITKTGTADYLCAFPMGLSMGDQYYRQALSLQDGGIQVTGYEFKSLDRLNRSYYPPFGNAQWIEDENAALLSVQTAEKQRDIYTSRGIDPVLDEQRIRTVDRARLTFNLGYRGLKERYWGQVVTDLYYEGEIPFAWSREKVLADNIPFTFDGLYNPDESDAAHPLMAMLAGSIDTHCAAEGDAMFFATPLFPGAKGEWGIYRAKGQDNRGLRTIEEETWEDGTAHMPIMAESALAVTPLATFPVGEAFPLRLDLAGDTLYLLCAQGKSLTLWAFGLDGEARGQAVLGALPEWYTLAAAQPGTLHSEFWGNGEAVRYALTFYKVIERDSYNVAMEAEPMRFAAAALQEGEITTLSHIMPEEYPGMNMPVAAEYTDGQWLILAPAFARDVSATSPYVPDYELWGFDGGGALHYKGELYTDKSQDDYAVLGEGTYSSKRSLQYVPEKEG